MRRIVSAVILTAAPFGAFAAEYEATCSKAGDARVIEVITPGTVGQSCDVRYTRGGGDVSVPYNANNSVDFCMTKAAELAKTLQASGYACTVNAARQAAAPQPAPVASPAPVNPQTEIQVTPSASAAAPQPAEPQIAEIQPAPTPAASEVTVAQSAPAERAVVEPMPVASAPAVSPAPAAATPAPIAAAPETDPVLEAKMSEILSEPAVEEPQKVAEALQRPAPKPATPAPVEAKKPEPVKTATAPTAAAAPKQTPAGAKAIAPAPAVRGPERLTQTLAEAPANPVAPAPVGRLVGATPDPETQQVVQPTEASLETVATTATAPGRTTPTAADLPPAELKEIKSLDRRRPADVIRATLRAQTAAWNEGNLDAFMETYWKDDNLVFVADDKVTKGWSAASRRYKDLYTDDDGLGRMSYNDMDVSMVTDDLAIVTGRYAHAGAEETDSGAFSLVMRQAGGVWRIVHDHMVVDAKSE